jgi:hypothetical protein
MTMTRFDASWGESARLDMRIKPPPAMQMNRGSTARRKVVRDIGQTYSGDVSQRAVLQRGVDPTARSVVPSLSNQGEATEQHLSDEGAYGHHVPVVAAAGCEYIESTDDPADEPREEVVVIGHEGEELPLVGAGVSRFIRSVFRHSALLPSNNPAASLV